MSTERLENTMMIIFAKTCGVETYHIQHCVPHHYMVVHRAEKLKSHKGSESVHTDCRHYYSHTGLDSVEHSDFRNRSVVHNHPGYHSHSGRRNCTIRGDKRTLLVNAELIQYS